MPTQDQYIFQNNERFELILKGINAGVYELDLTTFTCWWSSKFYDLLGYKRGDIESSMETLLNELIIPEDRQKLLAAWENCTQNKQPLLLETRLLHQSGNYRWFKITGQVKWDTEDKPIYLIGSLSDIEGRVQSQLKDQQNESLLQDVGLMARIGGWEVNLETLSGTWSKEVCLIHEMPVDYQPTLEEGLRFVRPDYKEAIEKAVGDALAFGTPFDEELKIITANKREIWVRAMGKAIYNDKTGKIKGIRGAFQDIDEQKKIQLENQKNESLLEEVGRMAKVGGWELNLDTLSVMWSKEVCIIHEVPVGFTPPLEEAINFYSPAYVPIIEKAVNDALTKGIPFNLELKIITAKKREVWVKALGTPIYDKGQQKIVGLRGVFQDIDERKEKELALQASLNLIDEQNKRLVNFAHIVSHNLKSHAANLELSLELLHAETDKDEKEHLLDNLNKISQSLNQTIKNLSDMVVIQTDNTQIKTKVKFEDVLQRIIATLKTEIEHTDTEIKADFNAFPEIEYIPAYLESIMLNLVSNAIKYRNPAKSPKISLKTSVENGKGVLTVSDNGLGFDMQKYGDKIFGMYKTFHDNPNARGIGLFITKNQIETLGGNICLESTINKGSIFKITF